MPPIALNRRRFLGCSAAAGLALSQGKVGEAAIPGAPVRLGMIGVGTRGTSLLRTLLELPNTQVVALCDTDSRHRVSCVGNRRKGQGLAAGRFGITAPGLGTAGHRRDRCGPSL